MAGEEHKLGAGYRIFFTAPWEPIVVRRGDALGLGALADQFAEAIAPGLSNRVRDGRWVTILAWCLARSQDAFHASGRKSVATRALQRERYGWLRPLELMWVARTIALATKDWRNRSLAGQRRVRPWYDKYANGEAPDRFGMTTDQFRAYRQTGIYGGYRVVFRKWRDMTMQGDGWTPGPGTNCLAKWLDERLGAARPPWPLHVASDDDHISTRSVKLNRGEEYKWWLRKWESFDKRGRGADQNTLPRRKDDFKKLPELEHLKPLVFGSDPSGKRRLEVATEVEKSSARDHMEVCKHLSSAFPSNRTIALLPQFSRLADAGMELMELVAEVLGDKSHIALADLVAAPAAGPICKELKTAANEWLKCVEMQIRNIEKVHRFATAVSSARPIDCLRALLRHHEIYGGGLRWFVLRNGQVEPRAPPRSGLSRYRFRLWSLCRLAVQCGVLRGMPAALRTDEEAEEEETGDEADE